MNLVPRDYYRIARRYGGQTLDLQLGVSRANEKPITYPMEKWGTTLVEAKSRTGKTSEIKSLLAQVHRAGRKIIIFDPYGDYLDLDVPNFRAREWKTLMEDVHIEKDFAFSLSKFTHRDFRTFGFTEKGLQLMGEISSRIDIHGNNPATVGDLIGDLPDKWHKVALFNQKYDLDLKRPLHEMMINSMSDTYRNMVPYFYDINVSPGAGIHCLNNVREIVREHKVVVFYFGLGEGGSVTKFQIYSAIILRELKTILEEIHALFVFDEGDLLAPNTAAGSIPPTSAHEVDEYCRKLGRTGTHMQVITQNHADLLPSLARNWHGIILGKLNPDSKFYEYTQDLYWDPRKGVREFLYIDSNNKQFVFKPPNPPTM
jgi:hypothetical protein